MEFDEPGALIESYIHEGGVLLEAIEKAFQENDMQQTAMHAHSLKGSSMYTGAAAVRRLSAEIEFAGKHNDPDGIPGKLAELKRVFSETTVLLRKRVLSGK